MPITDLNDVTDTASTSSTATTNSLSQQHPNSEHVNNNTLTTTTTTGVQNDRLETIYHNLTQLLSRNKEKALQIIASSFSEDTLEVLCDPDFLANSLSQIS